MTRDTNIASELRYVHHRALVAHGAVEQCEALAVRDKAELHAVLYGKVADAVKVAVDALAVAADLMDPETTPEIGDPS